MITLTDADLALALFLTAAAGFLAGRLHQSWRDTLGADDPDPGIPAPLGEGGGINIRASSREMTPEQRMKLRALNPAFAKADDDVRASEAHAEKILTELTGCKTQAAQPETKARGSLRVLPGSTRNL